MYILKKKVVILFIAFFIFFIGTIININQKYESGVIDIAIVSPEELQYETSNTSILTKDISNVISEFNNEDVEVNKIAFANYQVDNDKLKDKKFSEAVEYNDIIFVIGDQFNELMQYYIDENPKKQFVLVDNSKDYKNPNVNKISFDYKGFFGNILSQQTPNKLLYIGDSTNNDDFDNEYNILNNLLPGDDNIVVIDVANYDNIEIEEEINTLMLEENYNVIISTATLDNQIIVNAISNYNSEVEANIEDKEAQQEDAAEEEETSSSETKTDSTEKSDIEEIPTDYTKVHLYALGENKTISEENESVTIYEVDYEEIIKEIITNYLNEESIKDYTLNNYKI